MGGQCEKSSSARSEINREIRYEITCDFGAFSSDYITNLLEARARTLPEPSALHLTRRADLLELELPKPDLSLYDLTGGPRDDTP